MAYYVYLLASKKYGTLYLGVTNDIIRRVHEHKTKAIAGFSRKYSVDKLVWFEIYDNPVTAITREKELKKWRRDWKIRLIEKQNLQWIDLYPQIAGWLPGEMDSGLALRAPGMTPPSNSSPCFSPALHFNAGARQ
jgi:putative endonuclease